MHSTRQLLRFLVVGGSNTALTWALFLFLAAGLGVGVVLANILGWTAGAIWGFYWNRRWTFSAREVHMRRRQILDYAVVSLFGVALSTAIVAVTIGSLGVVGAQLAATLVTVAANFILMKKLVFARHGQNRGS